MEDIPGISELSLHCFQMFFEDYYYYYCSNMMMIIIHYLLLFCYLGFIFILNVLLLIILFRLYLSSFILYNYYYFFRSTSLHSSDECHFVSDITPIHYYLSLVVPRGAYSGRVSAVPGTHRGSGGVNGGGGGAMVIWRCFDTH